MAARAPAAPSRAPSFHHRALFHAGDEQFLAGVLPFVTEGLQAGEPVLVALGDARRELLSAALGEDACGVAFADVRRQGLNPARIIPVWQSFLDESAPDGRAARGVGEPAWAERDAHELDECDRHEQLLNVAFAGRPAWTLMCTYDEAALSADALETARRSHPFLGAAGECHANDAFSPRCAPFAGELEPAAGERDELAFDADTLPLVREAVRTAARDAGMAQERAEDLVLAVNELATNSVMHGGGRGTLHVVQGENTLVCEIRDGGHIEALLAGRLRPDPIRFGGRGLWLVNQVCDLVQIRSSPDAGTAVRVRMQLG